MKKETDEEEEGHEEEEQKEEEKGGRSERRKEKSVVEQTRNKLTSAEHGRTRQNTWHIMGTIAPPTEHIAASQFVGPHFLAG